MRILIGADQYPEYVSGAATFTARLARGLADRGHTVNLVWPSADGHRLDSFDAGLQTHRLSSVRLPSQPAIYACPPWSVGREIEDLMTATRPDVVHVQSHFPVGRTLIQLAQAAGVPVLATNHFMPDNVLPHVPLLRHAPAIAARAAWRDLARVYQQADAITVPTQRAVQLLAAATDLPSAQAISCGIDLERFHPGPALSPHVPTLLFVGRLEKEKHVDELLHALSRMAPHNSVRLDIVGTGSLRPGLERLSRRLELQDRVTFHGTVSHDDLLLAYHRADVFVMPGTAELQSLATLEAMAAARPVVAADAMALPHPVAHGENGYLYQPGDIKGLSQALTSLLDDLPLRRKMGERSLHKARQHSLEATVTAFEECYQRLIEPFGETSMIADSRTLLLAS